MTHKQAKRTILSASIYLLGIYLLVVPAFICLWIFVAMQRSAGWLDILVSCGPAALFILCCFGLRKNTKKIDQAHKIVMTGQQS
ncbi:hypothetical protein [Neopusillimonas maritima]|jgi:hypothetical protein|uniref:Uncharacterized protein n=1 Tax=Neopusillimonas maritima TaxID=2026239 RepID=A0ABX9MXZ4_9BURK|nr:hypothetical protein [Neopusillimonas maritima]RII83849.1 hypothetical protein CJO09_00990 [Neopusillimonas maritima]